MTQKPQIVDGKTIAAMLGVCEKTIRNWRNGLGLPFRKLGRLIRYDVDEVLAWFKARPAMVAATVRHDGQSH